MVINNEMYRIKIHVFINTTFNYSEISECFRYFNEILLTFNDITKNAIIAYTSQDFEYSSQNTALISQDYRIYITKFSNKATFTQVIYIF